MGVWPGSYVIGSGPTQYGIVAANLTIQQNSFSPLPPASSSTVIGTNYLNQAIYLSGPNSFSWTINRDLAISSNTGIFIENNVLTNVYDGITQNSIFCNSLVDNNKILLKDDNTFNLIQYGIAHINTNGRHAIFTNTVQGSVTGTISGSGINTLPSLIECYINSGVGSPSVACNVVSNSYNGFEIKSSNTGAIWAGNKMQNLARGLVLSNVGVMGTQGGSALAINNQWLGSTWTGTANRGTYVGTSSNAMNSFLWVSTGSGTPPNPGGNVAPGQLYGAPGTFSLASGGSYACNGIPNNRSIPIPAAADYTNANQYYIAQMALYQLLLVNDSVRNSTTAYQAFFSSLSASTPSVFFQIEQALYASDHSTAATLLSGLSTTNTVESNYKSFYTIYANYLGNGSLSSTDSTNLYNLTQLCPADNGACIHQARSLAKIIYQAVMRFPESCDQNNARLASYSNALGGWSVQLFPNPTDHRVSIKSSIREEILQLEIIDLSGRTVLVRNVNVSDFIANLDLELIEGAYLVKITNIQNESLVKMLLIDE